MNKNTIQKKITFDMGLLPIIQNLASLGKSEADVGMLIGYTGRKPEKFIEELKEQYPDVLTALEIGRKLADIKIVTTAFEAAIGCKYIEEVKEYGFEKVKNEETGEITRKKILKKIKKTPKHIKPDAAILKMLLLSRLPEYFIDSKKVTLTLPADGNVTEDEIRRFAGRLLEALPKKQVDSKEIIDAT